jgi:cytochrome oxidase Cu insertion factor (SCO1/SenC/PrrC family)
MNRLRTLAAALAAALVITAAVAQPAAAERPAKAIEAARSYFSDTELVDQHGENHRFYSDLLAGHVVVIDSMFTTCAAVCPVMGQKMKAIQQAAGDRLGKDVVLISISVDPRNDTPAKLREYAERYDAQPGWYFLTGDETDVHAVLTKLGFAVESKDDHSTIMLMGNEKTGLWKKTNGLSSSDELVELFGSVVEDDGGASVGG